MNKDAMDTVTLNDVVDIELDVQGLNCPLPILRTKKALSTMASGQRIRVKATDPGASIDFPAFCRHSGNQLLQAVEQDGVFVFVLQRR